MVTCMCDRKSMIRNSFSFVDCGICLGGCPGKVVCGTWYLATVALSLACGDA